MVARLHHMQQHLAPRPAASSGEELVPGIRLSVFPADGPTPPPFDEMAECVAQAFATYEPSLWGQGLQVNGVDACDTDKLEWTLRKTIRLMSQVCVSPSTTSRSRTAPGP